MTKDKEQMKDRPSQMERIPNQNLEEDNVLSRKL